MIRVAVHAVCTCMSSGCAKPVVCDQLSVSEDVPTFPSLLLFELLV